MSFRRVLVFPTSDRTAHSWAKNKRDRVSPQPSRLLLLLLLLLSVGVETSIISPLIP